MACRLGGSQNLRVHSRLVQPAINRLLYKRLRGLCNAHWASRDGKGPACELLGNLLDSFGDRDEDHAWDAEQQTHRSEQAGPEGLHLLPVFHAKSHGFATRNESKAMRFKP